MLVGVGFLGAAVAEVVVCVVVAVTLSALRPGALYKRF